jgi:CRISPR type III-associated protein (TIGR04423 family)
MKKNKLEIIDYINSLKGYQGYVQFSDTKIRECDIFKEFQDINLTTTNGFIYEAHFYNGSDSIAIRQINNTFYINEENNVPLKDTQAYIGINNLKIKMAQIWDEKVDNLCEDMKVKKLSKVVFVGFEKGDSK